MSVEVSVRVEFQQFAVDFSVEDEDRLREAQEIFEDLYYGSGDPGFREEGESCSRMLDRIRFGMK